MCPHQPQCPKPSDSDRDAARVTATYPEQGWSLLCNGVIIFDDLGELLPDGTQLPARRADVCRVSTGRRRRPEIQTLVARFAAVAGNAGIFAGRRCAQRPSRFRA
jgi:hypothetical protein